MIVSIKKILKAAQAGKFAVGAFNTSNLETTLAIVRAAVKKKAPVIIQTSESAIKYSNVETLFGIITHLAATIGKNVPIAIHLDHGKQLSIIQDCLRVGYNSVHIDASLKNFATNVKLTKQVVKQAHRQGIAVQAELGAILGKEGMVRLKKGQIKMKDLMTVPAEAQKFVRQTKVDTLAISVGTIHGCFKGIEKVDQLRLKKIQELVTIPLVLHGGSGLGKATFKTAIKNGIRVVNIDTNLRLAFRKALDNTLKQTTDIIDPRKILNPSTEAMQREVEKMIDIFGSSGKANKV